MYTNMYYVNNQHSNYVTDSDGLNDRAAAPIAVSGHYADSVEHIVGYSWQ